jgi:hypothetical protein
MRTSRHGFFIFLSALPLPTGLKGMLFRLETQRFMRANGLCGHRMTVENLPIPGKHSLFCNQPKGHAKGKHCYMIAFGPPNP